MRLAILNYGHNFRTKVLFAFIRVFTRQPTPDVFKLVTYRPEFLGAHLRALTHNAMRGPSAWSVGDRELMAALVSKVNECDFCIKAHSAVSARAYRNETKVAGALADLEGADIGEPLRATLGLLSKLTREHKVNDDDIRVVVAAGATREQIEDALTICFAFNMMNRLADAFEFFVPSPEAFKSGAKFLLMRGYR